MPQMSEEWLQKNLENKIRWFCGNTQAVEFVNRLFYAVEIWDDLIDKDVEVTATAINTVFTNLMFWLPLNDWFIENRTYYMPLIMQAINGFHDSNVLEKREEKHLRNLAFHIRNMGTEIHIATAFLTGGYEHMRKVSPEIREFFAFETFDEWDKQHV